MGWHADNEILAWQDARERGVLSTRVLLMPDARNISWDKEGIFVYQGMRTGFGDIHLQSVAKGMDRLDSDIDVFIRCLTRSRSAAVYRRFVNECLQQWICLLLAKIRYNDGDLIACFDKNISDAMVKEIAKRQPWRAVFRDISFASSPEKINGEEIFK